MRISFSPQRRDDTLEVSVAGDVLTMNGDTLDLSVLPDGASIADGSALHPFLTGSIERTAGEIRVTFILPHGADPSEAVAFPVPLIDPPDGPLAIPFDPPPAGPEIEEEEMTDGGN